MPSSPSAPPPAVSHSTAARLLWLTLLVVLAHALALGGLPSSLRLLGEDAETTAPVVASGVFVTRSLTPPATPPATPLAPPPARVKPTVTQRLPPAEPPAPARPGVAQTTATAEPAPAPAPAPVADAVPAAEPGAFAPLEVAAASSAAPPPAAPQTATPVALPPPTRLLYDGRGEEKGFIKYNGSGELLWLPEAAQYSARLEISAWGFRVRTWTSKGALADTGLAPLRFGDKPRGAELATHFQRDKGIISFSANNPDVALQPGAQDKLSAILQLSALVAGAPEHYAAGQRIRFQAADAHRAELWEFQVGASELLELPGGPLQGLKLSKAPTVEFDQGIEVWLAPGMHYLPVRLRITEASGAFVDLLWQKTQKPEGG